MQAIFQNSLSGRTFVPEHNVSQIRQKKNFARSAPLDPYARTAGSIHSISLPISARQQTLDRLAQAQDPGTSFENALAYASDNSPVAIQEESQNESYSFFDVIDAVNPLHHIPIVSTLYRGITGDEIKPAAQIIGGTLYGGPVGAVTSTVNVVVEHRTGRDVAGNAMAMITGDTIKTSNNRHIDRSRDLLAFESGNRTADVVMQAPSKNNLSNVISAYERTRNYNP